MDIRLIRKAKDFTPTGIFGNFCDSNGNPLFCTLEHAYPDAGNDPAGGGTFSPKIPPGVYKCKRRKSPYFGYDLFEVIDVPGHDFIEIHIGNTQDDSHGCILLGLTRKPFMLLDSRKAFEAFMQLQIGVAQFTLTVENIP